MCSSMKMTPSKLLNLTNSLLIHVYTHARETDKRGVSDQYLPTYIQDSLWACSALWRLYFGPPPTFVCRRLFLGSTRSSQSEEPSVAHVWLALLNSREGGEVCVFNDEAGISHNQDWSPTWLFRAGSDVDEHSFNHRWRAEYLVVFFATLLTPRMPYLSHMVQPHRKSISKLWLRMMMTCSLPNLSTVAWSVYRVQSVPDHHSSSITSSAQKRQHIMCIGTDNTSSFIELNMTIMLPVQGIFL